MVGRKGAMALGLALVLVAGCMDGGGDASSSTTSTTLPPLECPEPIAIASTQDLVAVLAATSWDSLGEYPSGSLSLTADLVVSGTVTLEAALVLIAALLLAIWTRSLAAVVFGGLGLVGLLTFLGNG